ncbi:MAG: hypothetical protein V1493_01610 [Candidatus Diapherotrites archaeon]
MKCPKCGMEMEKGAWMMWQTLELPIFQNLAWCKKIGLFKCEEKAKIMNSRTKEAFICKDCKVTCAEYE